MVFSSAPLLRRAAAALALALAGADALACGYRPVDVDTLTIAVRPPEATLIELPLYVILDPERVPESMIATAPGAPSITVENLPTLVERDLRAALGGVFRTVYVVAPDAQVPVGERILGFFGIDELGLAQASASDPRLVATVRFSLEIMVPGAGTHAYRFSGTAHGAVTLDDRRASDAVFTSAFTSALHRVVDGIARAQIAERLNRLAG